MIVKVLPRVSVHVCTVYTRMHVQTVIHTNIIQTKIPNIICFASFTAIYDCLGRTPFISLIATVLCCLGVGLFCGTLYKAIQITVGGIFEGLFMFDVPW